MNPEKARRGLQVWPPDGTAERVLMAVEEGT